MDRAGCHDPYRLAHRNAERDPHHHADVHRHAADVHADVERLADADGHSNDDGHTHARPDCPRPAR